MSQSNDPTNLNSTNKTDGTVTPATIADDRWKNLNSATKSLGKDYTKDYVAGHTTKSESDNNSNTDLTHSFANTPADLDIALLKVENLNIYESLKLAYNKNPKVDGNQNTGNATCSEGSESFIKGANYTGIKGVNVSEVSGLSASYVYGKRVAWLQGDAWSYQIGGNSVTNAYLNDMETVITANKITSTTSATGMITSVSACAGVNTSKRSGSDVNTINSGVNANEFIEFVACQNNYSGAAKITYNAISALATTTHAFSIGDNSYCTLKNTTQVIKAMLIETKDVPLHVDSNTQSYYKNCKLAIGSTIDYIMSSKSFMTKQDMKAEQTKESLAQTKLKVDKAESELKSTINSLEEHQNKIDKYFIKKTKAKLLFVDGDAHISNIPTFTTKPSMHLG
jgi:hypothetical protein